jgi:nucleotide-binding universal stress UspA family protein
VAFVARLKPPPRGEVSLFRAVEQLALPAHALSPSAIRGTVGAEVRRVNLERITAARKGLDRAAALLKRRGWRVRVVMTTGAPLRDLLATVATARAHAVVVGARGVSGVRHLLLGSVAEGVLNRCPVPVLVVR